MGNEASAMYESEPHFVVHNESEDILKKKTHVSFESEEQILVRKDEKSSFIEYLMTDACGNLATVEDTRQDPSETRDQEEEYVPSCDLRGISVDAACSDAKALMPGGLYDLSKSERYTCAPKLKNRGDNSLMCSMTDTVTSPTNTANKTGVIGISNHLHQLIGNREWDLLRSQLTGADSDLISRLAGEIDENGRTPLMLACLYGRELPPDVTRLLVNANSNAISIPISHDNGRHTTCLHVAASSACSPATLRLLLSAHPKAAETVDKFGNMPLHLVVNSGQYRDHMGYEDDMFLLSASASASSEQSSLVSVQLYEEEESLHVTVCRLLIEAYPEALLHRNGRGATPLLLAIYSRAPADLMTFLLSRGDRVSASIADDFGCLPIHFCDRAPSAAIVHDLLHFYPEGVAEKNRLGDTPLYFAMADNCDLEVLSALLECAESPRELVDSKNNKDQNILTFSWISLFTEQLVAAEDQDEEEARLLKNRKLIKDATSRSDIYGSQIALWWEKATLLLCAAYHDTINFGEIEWNAVHAAAGTDCPPLMVEFILKIHPEDVGSVDKNKNTPLHVGASRPNVVGLETMEALVKAHPPSMLMKNADGYTPLAISCKQGAPMDILQLLLNACPLSVCVQNKEGQTALFISILVGSSIDVVRMLLEACPDAVHIRDKNGLSPIGLAWQMLVAGKDAVSRPETNKARSMVEPKVIEQEELRQGKSNRLVLATAKSSSSLTGDVRLWVAKIDLLLRAFYHGTVKEPLPEGRQWRAVHAACAGGACPPEVLAFALQILPKQAHVRNEAGFLPLHIASLAPPHEHNCLPQLGSAECIDLVIEANKNAIKCLDGKGRLPLHCALETKKTWNGGVKSLVTAFPESVLMRHPKTGLFPFMMAACSTNGATSSDPEKKSNAHTLKTMSNMLLNDRADVEEINTIYSLLRLYPHTVSARRGQAETFYLKKKQEELVAKNRELEQKVKDLELELEGRMSTEEVKVIDRKKKQGEIHKREELCRSRSERLELTSTLARKQISELFASVQNVLVEG